MAGFSLLVLLSLSACAAAGNLSWAIISPSGLAAPPQSRWYAGAAFRASPPALFVFGGKAVNKAPLGDTHAFDIAGTTGTWRVVIPAMSPPARFGFVSGVMTINGVEQWVISHGQGIDGALLDDTWAFNLGTEQWEDITGQIIGDVPRRRYGAAGGSLPGAERLWLSMGRGANTRLLSDTWVLERALNFTDGTLSWREMSPGAGLNQYDPFSPHARAEHAGTPLSNNSFAIFGGCADGGQVGGPCPLQDSWLLKEDGKWKRLPVCSSPRTGSSMVGIQGFLGRGLLWGGNDNTGPPSAVFPQRIVGPDYSGNELYILDAVDDRNISWTRVFASPSLSPRREGAATAYDRANGVVYMFGGRRIASNVTVDLLADVWRLSGDGAGEGDQGCLGITFTFVHLHGVLMYAAWGLFLPLGACLGRYYRWTWPLWFVLHIISQSAGVLLTVAGFVIIFLVANYEEPNFPHAIIGIVLTAVMLQQFLNGIFHPCVERENGQDDDGDKSGWRKCWEVYHAIGGFIAVAIGIAQVTLGVFLVDPPLPVWAVWCGLGGLWLLIFAVHEAVYLCCKCRHTSHYHYDN